MDDAKLVGVAGDKQTTNSCTINFTNNPPSGLAIADVGNSYVKITWNNPAGLLPIDSKLDYFNILRNGTNIGSIYLDKGKGTYNYTDTGIDLINGTHYRYEVQAFYDNAEHEDNPTSTVLKATPLAITAFYFSNPPATGTIDHTHKTIKVAVPNGTDRTALIANFTATGAIVKVGTTTQTSGTTANDFTDPVTYILTTSNDASTCSYVVTVNENLATPVTEDGTKTTSSIQAKWGVVSGAVSYLLDVSTNSSFSSFLPGYQDKSLTSTSCIVNGLNYNTAYYYRVKAVANDQYFNSEYSTTQEVTTESVSSGEGSTEINSSEETTINVGNYPVGEDNVTPTVKVHPANFSPSDNDIITVSMSYGTTPEGLQYNLAFDNPTIGIGTFILSYSGLSDYTPTDVGYRLNGGELQSVGPGGINPSDQTVTFVMSSLSKGSKEAYTLQIVLNDESGQTLPVVLSSFTATLMVQGKVRLDWVTQSETNLSGFRVLRNTVAEVSTATSVSNLIAAANTSSTVVYSFIDSEVPGNGIYYYWLQMEDLDGGISYSAALAVQVTNGANPDTEIPKITALQKPFPNPFNPDVTIPFDLAVEGKVTITIYNLKGQLIRDLLNENYKAASHRIVWNGKDNEGHYVSTGTYVIQMNAPGYNLARKISLLK
ncbi:MAG TPA: FlgD immunoglobulin-like domain containing protein [Candidatus Cloacimonas sp.]|nr:FlgD immunoglobulin-like domain containing protein [Candidatus Cloacimonas sp.]